jgi:hypothetical protein
MADTKNQDQALKSARAARGRRMNAAKRSLKLVKDVVDQHLGLLESDPPQVPEADFVTSAVKYAQALGELRTLDMVLAAAAGADASSNGKVELDQEDVAALLETVSAFVPAGVLNALPPLARVAAAVAPAEPEEDQAGNA